MNDVIVSAEELFGPAYEVGHGKPKEKQVKEKIGASEVEIVNQLCSIQSATVFGDLFVSISELAREKRINLYVYRRDKGERYKHRYYWGIFAVRSGSPKTLHPKELRNVIASIEEYPYQVNHHKSSKQYSLLRHFLAELRAYDGK